MSDSELDYLASDFDASKLTVDRLRGILVSHDVKYPSSAKKAQLVEIFNDSVLPQARKLLRAQARIKRTSKGIEDVPSSQSSVAGEIEEPAPSTTKRKPARKSVAAVAEPSDTLEPPVKKTPSRRSTSKRAHSIDVEQGADTESRQPPSRRPRKSEVPSAVKVEEPDQRRARSGHDDGVFSSENPFQTGSSPMSGDSKQPSGTRRRKSAGPPNSRDGSKRKSSGGPRRKTDHFAAEKYPKAEDGFVVPSTQKFEVPVRRIKKEPRYSDSDDGIVAGEEFAPEEAAELEEERIMNGGRDLVATRQGQRKSRPGRISRSAPWVILLTLLGGYATWWRREKIEVGYCGIGSPSTTLADYQAPDWLSVLEPQCEPCPPHAYCYTDMVTKCEPDFVLQPHPLSLGGLVPLAPTCEPDGEKARKVKAVADRAVEELRERRAKYECGDLVDEKNKATKPSVEISETKLKEAVGEKRRKGMTQSEFENLWQSALGEVLNRDEILVGTDQSSSGVALTSTSLSRLSLGCAIRRSARLALARYRVQLGGVAILTLFALIITQRIRSLSAAKARVPNLVALTLNRLATHAAYHAQDPRAVPEPWVSVGQLRDDVLRDEFSPKRREELWSRVRSVVEMNANVRASVREARGGEVSRVWEWIGSVGALEDGGFSAISSKNFSGNDRRRTLELQQQAADSSGVWGGEDRSSPLVGREGYDVRDAKPEMGQRPAKASKWDEGRPIY
ncbi:MAG: hypothetical protein M4579_003871 [Chaenotheca gracillima]|nr:MAG: hypothetical protein M4579_003871 [Chaenotheca gracillima]